LAGETLGEVIRRLGRCGGLQGDLAQTDAQLLDRFARRRDEPAFAALVARHGPMILGLCRRLLSDPRDAEDAFQAVFLILARKAGAIQRRTLLGPWLYGVAWRVALPLRGQTARRRQREQGGVDLDALPADHAAWSDARQVVQEEVQRLPDVYRSAVILCCLEGKTNEEAARLLRRPVGTVKSRLTRARELLRSRLTRRGMTASVGSVGATLAVGTAPASAALGDATVRAASLFAAGTAAAARAVTLAQGALRTMMLKKVTFAAAFALAAALLGGGALAYHAFAAAPPDGKAARAAEAPKSDAPKAEAPKDDAAAIQGVWRITAVEIDGKEQHDEDARWFKKQTWEIGADRIGVKLDPEFGNIIVFSTYTIYPTRSPKGMDITPVEETMDGTKVKSVTERAIYSLEGDVLKLCRPLAADGERPKQLVSKEGDRTRLLILRRVKPGEDKPKEDKPADAPKDDLQALQGAWRLVSDEVGGKEAMEKPAEEEWVVRDRMLTMRPKDPNQVPHTETFVLRPDKTPKQIDIDPYPVGLFRESDLVKGIYTLDGDVWKLCLPGATTLVNPPAEAKERPKEMATKPGGYTHICTFQRIKPEPEKPKEDKPTDDKQALEGTWQVVSVEEGGKEATGGRADQERKAEWVVKGHWIGLQSKDPNFVALDEVFAVRPDKNPKEIDINPYPVGVFLASDVDKGVYTLDGDVWKVCLAKWPMDPDDPPRPKEMATKEGARTVLITLKRVKPDEDKPKDDKPPQAKTPDGAHYDIIADAMQPAGSPVLLKLVLTNKGKEPLTFWVGGPADYPPINIPARVTDAAGKTREMQLSNGQALGGSGLVKSLGPGDSVTIPAAMAPLPAGDYRIEVGDGSAKIAVKDDPEMLKKREDDLLTRIHNGEPFAQHAAAAFLTPSLRERLLKDLSVTDSDVAWQAIQALGGDENWPADAVPLLAQGMEKQLALEESQHKRKTPVLIFMAERAGLIGTDEALDAVLKLTHSEMGKGPGVEALGMFKQERAVRELHSYLKSPDKDLRYIAALTLAKRHDPTAVETLLAVIADGTGTEREFACRALVNYPDDPRAEQAMISLLNDIHAADEARQDLKELRAAKKK